MTSESACDSKVTPYMENMESTYNLFTFNLCKVKVVVLDRRCFLVLYSSCLHFCKLVLLHLPFKHTFLS